MQRTHQRAGKKNRTLSRPRGCGFNLTIRQSRPYSNNLSVVPGDGGPPFRFSSGAGGATGFEGVF